MLDERGRSFCLFVVRKGEARSHEKIWGKIISGGESSSCKGPVAGLVSVLKEEQEASVAGKRSEE